FERVIAALHRELPERRVAIRLGDPVTSVQWNPRRVLVTTLAGARIEARAVIVTLPLGVLQALPPAPGAITFEPELEHKRTLWNRLQFGHALRINLRFGEGLWDDPLIPAALRANEGRDFGFLHAQDGAFPVWWASAPAPVLTGWT